MRRNKDRARATGATALEYVACVALFLGLVIASAALFGASLKTLATCLGSKLAGTGGSCGASGSVQGASAAASGFAEQPKGGALVCDNLGCHPNGDVVPVCFAKGTQVATADGARPIEEVREGDLVWAAGESRLRLEPASAPASRGHESRRLELRRVVSRKRTVDQPVIDLEIAGARGAEVIRTTRAHPFFVEGRGFVAAGALVSGDLVRGLGAAARVVATSSVAKTEDVFNFEVEGLHTYFVGRSEALVHNDCGDPPKGPKDPKDPTDTKPLGPMGGGTTAGPTPGAATTPTAITRLTPGGSWGEIYHQLALPSDGPIWIDGKTPAERLAIIKDAEVRIAGLGDVEAKHAAAMKAAEAMTSPQAKTKAIESANKEFGPKLADLKAAKQELWKAKHGQLIEDYVRQVGDGQRLMDPKGPKPEFNDVASKGDSTKDLRAAFERDPEGTKAAVRARLLGGPPSVDQIRAFEGRIPGLAPGDKVAVIWNREGSGYGADRVTDPQVLERMIKSAQEKGFKVVVMGDPLPPDAAAKLKASGGHDLTGLWKDPAFKDYGTQLQLLEWLRARFGGVQLGMKSGAMDGGAFIGMPTTEVVPERGAVVFSTGSEAKPIMTGGKQLVLDEGEIARRTGTLPNDKAKAAVKLLYAKEVMKQNGYDPKKFSEIEVRTVEGKEVVFGRVKGGQMEPVAVEAKPLVVDMAELEKAVAGKPDRAAAIREFLKGKIVAAGLDPASVPSPHLEHQRMMALEGKVPGFTVVDVGELQTKTAPSLEPVRAPVAETPKGTVIEQPTKGAPPAAKPVSPGVYVAGAVAPIVGAGIGRIVEHETGSPVAGLVVSTSIGVAPVVIAGGLRAVPGALLPGLAGAGVKYTIGAAGGSQTQQDAGGMVAAATVGGIWGAPFGGPVGTTIGAGVGVIVYSGSEIVGSLVDMHYEGKRGEAIDGAHVQNAYFRVFGREADPDGLALYTRRMTRSGWSWVHVRRSLAQSEEGTQRITAVYETLAGRKPSEYELKKAIHDFGEGKDTIQALQARLIVQKVWMTHLGRPPTAQELKDRELELLGGKKVTDFEAEVKNSHEGKVREASIMVLGRPPNATEIAFAKDVPIADLRKFFVKTPGATDVIDKMFGARFGRKPTDAERKTMLDRLQTTPIWTLDQELFVRRTYILYLGREPSADEIKFRVQEFEKGNTAENLDKGVRESPEAQARLLYMQITGKDALDKAKYGAQIDAIAKGKLVEVRREIAFGPEAAALTTKLYERIFLRKPTDAELKAIAERLASGETTMFLVEQELVIRKLYFVYFGREPTKPELDAAMGEVLKGKDLAVIEQEMRSRLGK